VQVSFFHFVFCKFVFILSKRSRAFGVKCKLWFIFLIVFSFLLYSQSVLAHAMDICLSGVFKMDKASYSALVKRRASRTPVLKNTLLSFLFGGGICGFGEALARLFSQFGFDDKKSYTFVTISLVFLSALLTGLGLFDRIARHAGAGTLVPVTGFANAVVSPAIDTKSEGLILGVGAKIFTIAGPVLLYGTLAGFLYGLIYYIFSLFGG
jgi:stage V sporulation protein AC